MTSNWPYYDLHSDGYLYVLGRKDKYVKAFSTAQPHPFKDSAEAEQWLKDQDIPGNVR